MRLTKAQLKEITGKIQPTAQYWWFKENLGADLPRDRMGPIITVDAYNELVRRKCGLVPAQAEAPVRPQVRLVRGKVS